MNENAPFKPTPMTELKARAVNDVDYHKLLLEEFGRWAKHCGHYPCATHLENYMKLIFS